MTTIEQFCEKHKTTLNDVMAVYEKALYNSQRRQEIQSSIEQDDSDWPYENITRVEYVKSHPFISRGCYLIQEERYRQIKVEGFDAKRDAIYVNGELAKAAVAFALPDDIAIPLNDGVAISISRVKFFPKSWGPQWFKLSPDNRIKDLVKAGALIAAEIDRLNNLK